MAVTFSLVVAAHDVQDYLRECLDSITGQDFADWEAIVVDDASHDASGAIADAVAGTDPRVSVLHLADNVGLGGARNAGMRVARGAYLMFVDGDDMLADGALSAIAQRIDAAGQPDVVVFHHERFFPDGRVEPAIRAHLLARPGELDLRARQALLGVLPTAWNKAHRREFVQAHGFKFPSGTYEDLPWTYPVLMSAASVVTLERSGYRYRQQRAGSILASSGRRHLDVIAQYGRVFAYLDEHPEYESWRQPIFDRMVRHIPSVLEMTSRIPPAERRSFFDALVAAVRRHHPSGYRPAGRLGVKVWLLEHGGYRAFRAAQVLNQVRRRLRGPTR